jgi:hypothetical protein
MSRPWRGNLAGHLLTLRPGVTALGDEPILNRRWLEGMSDTFGILVDAVGKDPPAAVLQFEEALNSAAAARPVTLADARVQVERLAACAADAAAQFTADGAKPYGLRERSQLLGRGARDAMRGVT